MKFNLPGPACEPEVGTTQEYSWVLTFYSTQMHTHMHWVWVWQANACSQMSEYESGKVSKMSISEYELA